jgi:hypothetical protein
MGLADGSIGLLKHPDSFSGTGRKALLRWGGKLSGIQAFEHEH